MHTIFKNTRFIDVIEGVVRENKDIEILDGKIKTIGEGGSLTGGEEIDGSNLLLVPGLSTPTPISV